MLDLNEIKKEKRKTKGMMMKNRRCNSIDCSHDSPKKIEGKRFVNDVDFSMKKK